MDFKLTKRARTWKPSQAGNMALEAKDADEGVHPQDLITASHDPSRIDSRCTPKAPLAKILRAPRGF
jgi:hypothetical protein